jgi:hypothetical protein
MEKNTNSEEWFVRKEIYFSHRRTTFTASPLVESLSVHTPTPSYHHHVGAPKKVLAAKGVKEWQVPLMAEPGNNLVQVFAT